MASGVLWVLTDTMMPAAERLDDPQAAAFADIAAVREEPEPGIWILESW